ncbi:hypothetical protein [Burkholderia ubonensis]|uniref:Uncharacterized protein n=1 Tax=Burkholderia ubonensis TaxID=101571 RepID=A0A107FRB6_9BURK|nr:hypothetical protein [Burkholderia ubonensis]KWD85054.1 hypothetical protein WL70_01430 [Burkholderia ubonensis]KWD90913.1 hypothetical protein WL71_07615 [Burkholderia ubonensis]KWD98247.1 hypothetical protein WL73_19990 [Burkholderia ubonensis]KWE00582.1 hypothetical protein WL72_11480 [Burkholderia ubonensis]
MQSILATNGITLEQFAALLDTPAFVATLRDSRQQMKEHGAAAVPAATIPGSLPLLSLQFIF